VSAPLDPNGEAVVEPMVRCRNRRRRRLRYLQKAIETSYNTVVQTLMFDGLSIELRRVADVDTLLDRLPKVQFRADERLPYWADLWPSSLALAQYLWEAVDLQGLQVLELGCGMGLAGIVAGRKGGLVTLTDYEADALMFARYNALHNRCQHTIVRHLDWQTPTLSQAYAVLIASDILYERANFLPLLHLLQRALASHGHFIVAEPNRPWPEISSVCCAIMAFGTSALPRLSRSIASATRSPFIMAAATASPLPRSRHERASKLCI
jgi:predicted nicotinamide N-methyase